MIVVVHKNKFIATLSIIFIALAIYGVAVVRATGVAAVGKRTVMLDPGHGGEDPGAVSDFSGAKEKDINLSIALKLKDLLEKENYSVVMTRQEDKLEYHPDTTNIVQKRKQDLLRRKKMMDEGNADIVVSIHMNKFPDGKYSGAQTFFPSTCTKSQKLAFNIQKSIREEVDTNNKREALEKKEPIIILKDVKTPTTVVECGFLSNAEEEKKIVLEDYHNKIATAIKCGINKYFEETEKNPPQTSQPKVVSSITNIIFISK